MSARHVVLTAALAASLAVSCSADDGGDDARTSAPTTASPSSPAHPSTPLRTGTQSPTASPVPGPVAPSSVEEIVTGLDAPWAIAFLDDGAALVTQRDTDTVVRVDDTGDVTDVGTVPGVEGGGEGGLLGLTLDPADPSMLYVYATLGAQNAVMRTTFSDGALGEFETVLDGIPAGSLHNGGRLRFGPDGMLYVSTGETGNPDDAQDVENLGGKILRITPDGEIPPDNPIDGSPVYSYGHRNVQGLAFDDDGRLWASEFGDRDADELNLIEPGGNYGWPEAEGITGDDRFIDPEVEWRPTAVASPSGLAYVRDTFFVTALRGERLWQVPLVDGEAGEPTAYLEDFGRLRDAAVAPDGTLWVLTNNTDGRGEPRDDDDRILRVQLAP